jgi:hypothetical protein
MEVQSDTFPLSWWYDSILKIFLRIFLTQGIARVIYICTSIQNSPTTMGGNDAIEELHYVIYKNWIYCDIDLLANRHDN